MSILSEKLKKLRKEKGISLDTLSEETKTSKSYLWELENDRGENKNRKPSAEKLDVLAKYYGVSVDYLLNDNPEDANNKIAQKIFTRVKELSKEDQKKIDEMIDLVLKMKK